jgi:1,4-alpha-glucan branching enzyme
MDKLAIIQEDPWLDPYIHDVHERFDRYKKALKDIEQAEGSLLNFFDSP